MYSIEMKYSPSTAQLEDLDDVRMAGARELRLRRTSDEGRVSESEEDALDDEGALEPGPDNVL